MRRALLLACLLATASLGAGCFSPGGLVGKPVPAFSLVTSEGERVNQTTWQGRYVVLDLMATWCAPCKLEVDHLKGIHAAYGDRVAILSIGADPTETSAELDQFAKDHGATWPHALDFDGSAGRAMGLNIIPKLVVVDPQGNVVLEREGEVLPAVIAAAIEGRPIPSAADAWLPLATGAAGVGLGFLAAFNPYRRLHRHAHEPRAAWLALALLALLALLAWPLAGFLSGRATYGSLAIGAASLGAAAWWLRARRKPAPAPAPRLVLEAGDRAYEAAPAFALALVLALGTTTPWGFAAPFLGVLLGYAAAVATREQVPERARDALGLAGLGLAGVGLLAFGAQILLG